MVQPASEASEATGGKIAKPPPSTRPPPSLTRKSELRLPHRTARLLGRVNIAPTSAALRPVHTTSQAPASSGLPLLGTLLLGRPRCGGMLDANRRTKQQAEKRPLHIRLLVSFSPASFLEHFQRNRDVSVRVFAPIHICIYTGIPVHGKWA